MIKFQLADGKLYALRDGLGKLGDQDLSMHEQSVNERLADLIIQAEKRAPGYLATRLIARIDERPIMVCGVPAHLTGGATILDFTPGASSSIRYIETVLWPKLREQFRQDLLSYFARVMAGEKIVLKDRPRRVRVAHLSQAVWFLAIIDEQASLARRGY